MIKKTLGMVTLAVGLLSTPALSEPLKVGVNPEYPPFEFKDKDGELKGFDIDLMNALCETMERECEYSEVTFDELIPKLTEDEYDIIISAIDVTEDRAEKVLFSEPYYLNHSIYIMRDDPAQWIEDVGVSKLGVLAGSTHQQYLYNKYVGTRVNIYKEYPDAIKDLEADKIQLVFGDGAVVAEYIKKNSDLTTYGDEIVDEEFFGAGLALAANLENEALIEEVNAALETLKEEEIYDEIYGNWFE